MFRSPASARAWPPSLLCQDRAVALIVERGEAVSAAGFSAVGHGCQVELQGLHWAMDPAFRTAFPAMYETWETLVRTESLQPGDQVATLLSDSRTVHTLAIKRGMRDPVDLDAVVSSVQRALAETTAQAIAFHRIATRCDGRLPWRTIAAALEPVAASSATDIVVLTDEWDALVDSFTIGKQIRATVTHAPVFGAFLDIGYPFPAFIDVISISPNHHLEVGQSLEIEIIHLDDARKQVRARPADPDLRHEPVFGGN